MKINQIEAGISTFEVPGSKWNLLLPGTSSGAVKPLFLPGSSLFLPAGDTGGEIKCLKILQLTFAVRLFILQYLLLA